ncbi:BaiN/RdsA family NAD(P)/FAD-dependent oxidoreductase [Natronospora cellulosivora (SeqCode)]
MIVVDTIVIGAGPAGLFTAIQASSKNQKIIVLEKNPTAGKKLLITGAGQCNLTQEGKIKEFLDHYGDNYRFLRQALYKFSNENLLLFFKERGIDFVSTEKGKIFPSSYKAKDILNVLLNECKKKGIEIKLSESVKEVKVSEKKKNEDHRFYIKSSKEEYKSKYLVIATGGKSYPTTGSSGDGYSFAKSLGHKIIEPQPALAPLYIKDYSFTDLSGISLSNSNISLWRDKSLIKRWTGDILFTHKGISGPGILNYSRYILANDIIKIKLINSENKSNLDQKILKMINSNGKVLFKNLIKDLPLPQRLLEKLLELANISDDTKASQLSKEQRKKLINLLFELTLEVKKLGEYNQAMVTKGGVNLKELNPKTMESRIVNNLFAVGEVLDIDGDTGGYNLQAAFSTGYLAGKSIREK